MHVTMTKFSFETETVIHKFSRDILKSPTVLQRKYLFIDLVESYVSKHLVCHQQLLVERNGEWHATRVGVNIIIMVHEK
jgi:hypothetical protein